MKLLRWIRGVACYDHTWEDTDSICCCTHRGFEFLKRRANENSVIKIDLSHEVNGRQWKGQLKQHDDLKASRAY